MRKINPKDVFIPTISLFIICIVITAALAVTNGVTAHRIAENEAQSQQESMSIVCPDAKSFEEIKEDVVYVGKDNSGKIVGYAISTVSNGYGGQIKVMTGIKDGEILGIDVYYNDDETPGLGKNTSNESFTSQFEGLLADSTIAVSKDYSGKGQKVDAVTSSTISSRAVVAAVNNAIEIYNTEVIGGE